MENGDQPATKRDLAVLETALRLEITGLKSELTGLNSEITGLKSEMTGFKSELTGLKSEMTGLESRLMERAEMNRAESQHRFDSLEESMRDIQTELLKAFYGFAQSVEIKLKDGEVADFLTRQRMTAVEIRQTEVERRINTPPPQN